MVVELHDQLIEALVNETALVGLDQSKAFT